MRGLLRSLRRLSLWEWTGYLAGVIVFAIVCVLLSRWQFDRRDQAVAEIQKVQANWSAEVSSLDRLVPDEGAFDDALEYRRVELHGTYLSADQVLVRNRPLDGQPGFEVLVPLRLDGGDVFFVDRGWVATGDDGQAPADIPAPPEGEVTVVVRLRPAQQEVDRSAPDGQIASFSLPQVVDRYGLGDAYTAMYGDMVGEDPATAERPTQIPQPSLSEGSHLSYALQWLVFAVLAFVGFGYAIRQTLRRLDATGGSEVRAQRQRRESRRRRDADEIAEDEILDGRR